MSYQVFEKSKLFTRKGLPDASFMTLDLAMQTACAMSKGTTKKRIYVPKKNPVHPWDGGTYEEVDIPNAYAVVDRNDKESRVRGWGIAGKWFDARDCKRCANTGEDPTFYGDVCSSCRGSSFKPSV